MSIARWATLILVGGAAILASIDANADFINISLDPASPTSPESDIVAGSFGQEPIDLFVAGLSTLYFSVDRVAIGLPGSPVAQQAQIASAHGDLYSWTPGNNHQLYLQETDLTLIPGFFGDDLDAVQIRDGSGLVVNSSFPYFSRWRNSPLLGSNGEIAADILFETNVFANGVTDIGLLSDDALDALIMMDVTPDAGAPGGFIHVPNGVLDPGFDLALFSLDPFSPSGLPGDLFLTSFDGSFSVFATAFDLQLSNLDNLDALTLRVIPEPSAALILAITCFSVSRRYRSTSS